MLNRVTITGRMTADPELKKTNSDISVIGFSIACERNYKKSDGEKETDFFNVVAWRSTSEFVGKYFRKGALITVDGHLQSRRYTDKEGNNRVAIEIVADSVYFGNSKNNNSGSESDVNNNDAFVPNLGSDTDNTNADIDFPFDFPSM